jgi:hypothetical protein
LRLLLGAELLGLLLGLELGLLLGAELLGLLLGLELGLLLGRIRCSRWSAEPDKAEPR